MTADAPARRYAKGDAKRREILEAALRVIAERGYRNSSLQEIADAVGLTKAGVLHYFDSREGLLAEVLRERDASDESLLPPGGDAVGLLSEAVRHNSEVPGLVQLYSRLVVESEAPEHPGHDYVAARYRRIETMVADAVRARQAAGSLRADVDPLLVARVLTAVSDGLQLQWLHDPSVDMSEAFDEVVRLFQA